jgi:triacylglycerol esterase/lipase EstA (alpha/beta hydrolase family)
MHPAKSFFRAVGRSIASAYQALDPELRKHVAEVPLLGLTLLARPRPIAPLPDDGHRPLLFVHGLGGGPGNLYPMRAFFRLKGRSRSYAVAFPDGLSLEGQAAHLTRCIAEVIAVNRLPDDATVDVVGHSMGGVVARIALLDPITARRVSTLVTLGTPHGGTSMARFLRTPLTLALRPDSPELERLRAQLPWRSGDGVPRLVCFWSPDDLLLHPPSAARVEGALNIEMPGFTHNTWLLKPRAWRPIQEALRS